MPANTQTSPPSTSPATNPGRDDGTALIDVDPWLEPYADRLRGRYAYYRKAKAKIDEHGGLLGAISQGHHYFGFNRGEQNGAPGVWYREWAPAAYQLSLIGDFNGWDRNAHRMTRDPFGTWSIFLPDAEYASRLVHGSKIKVHVHSEIGHHDRIPAYIRRVVQEPDHSFTGVFWMPPQAYAFKHPRPRLNRGLAIYEAHVGMATEQEKVGTFAEFTRDVLPRVKDLNYDAVQLMAVMEHP
jgi:1,4-alpha-glucan branching enzyme